MRSARVGQILVLVLLLGACSQLTVTKIKPGEEDGGLAYCLLVPKLQVMTKQALVYDKEDVDGPPYSRAARPVTEKTVTLVQMPSYDLYYTVKVKSGWFTSDSYSIGYDANGCLNNYTFTTVDQTANVIATVGSIALAAAAVAAAETPGISVPEPSPETYLLDRTSRKLLKLAETKIDELTVRIQKLLDKGARMTDQDRQAVDKLRDDIANVLDKTAKLRSVLEPTPTRIIKTEYANVIFIPESENADKYVVRLVQEAEAKRDAKTETPRDQTKVKRDVNKEIPSDQSGELLPDFVIGVARRVK